MVGAVGVARIRKDFPSSAWLPPKKSFGVAGVLTSMTDSMGMRSKSGGAASGEQSLRIAAYAGVFIVLAMLVLGGRQFALLRSGMLRQHAVADVAYGERDRLLQLVNEETGVRGYVATGDERFLDVYRQSLRHYNRLQKNIATNATAIPTLQHSMRAFIPIAGNLQLYFEGEIRLVSHGKRSLAAVQLGAGKHMFDEVRAVDAVVQDESQQQWEEERNRTLALSQEGIDGAAVVATLTFALYVYAFVVVRSTRARSLLDPLTGVGNRAQAEQTLSTFASRGKEPFGLVYLDLDGFKKINDGFGHSTGDAILKMVALRLKRELRGDDVVCRIGGDEFVCFIASPVDAMDLQTIASRLHHRATRPYEHGGDEFVVGCSAGWTMYPERVADVKTLLDHADRAMYEAKTSGGGVRAG